MEGGSRAGELRKLSSSLSPAIPSKLTWTSLSQLSWVSLSQLSLGTRDYGNVRDVLQKNQQHDEMYNFVDSESGLENSIWIHRRTKNIVI